MANPKFTDTTARNARILGKAYRLTTGRGFYLYISPAGKKVWRYDYRLNGNRNVATLGTYPAMSLLDAEIAYQECKKLIASGVDPNTHKKQAREEERRQAREEIATFESVAREWLKKRMSENSEKHRHDTEVKLVNHILPHIGNMLIAKMDVQAFLVPVRLAEKRDKFSMAHKLAQIIKQIGKYAKVAGYTRHNEAADINEAMQKKPQAEHRAAITDPERLGTLLKDIDALQCGMSTKYAIKILPYVFTRPSELRLARWAEFDLESRQWLIPEGRMKMRRPHIVPLARQVIALLTELKEYTGHCDLLFPGSKSIHKPITDVTLLNALRVLGYSQSEMCLHGFRGTASTLLNEKGYRHDLIEMQLAHCEANKTRAAYNHAEYQPERASMMQEWADYLDGLKAAAR